MKLSWPAYCLFALLIFLVGLSFWKRSPPDHPFFSQFDPSQYPLVIAHADDTGAGLWPGSTLPFLAGMSDLGVDILELDLHMTKDGHLVVMHDNSVNRTTNGSGKIKDMTLSEIKSLEVAENWSNNEGQSYPYQGKGLQVPTLREVFAQYPDYPMIIEIKQDTPSIAITFCKLLNEYKMGDKVLIPSFHDIAIKEFRSACPEVATASSSSEARNFVLSNFILASKLLSPKYHAFHVPTSVAGIPVVTSFFVDSAQGRNLQVHVWTINKPQEMRRLISMGVDGIMTDRPDILMKILGRHKENPAKIQANNMAWKLKDDEISRVQIQQP